jgi:hypothetical protein
MEQRRAWIVIVWLAASAAACGTHAVRNGNADASSDRTPSPSSGLDGLGGATGGGAAAADGAPAAGGSSGGLRGEDGSVGGADGAARCCADGADGIAPAGDDGPQAAVDSANREVEDASVPDGTGLSAPDASDSGVRIDGIPPTYPSCPFPLSTPPKEGCLASSATLYSTAMAMQVGGYQCTAASNANTTRIRACVWMQDNPCTIDDEIGYCVVVEMATDTLASLPVGSEISLAGVTTFAIPNLYDVSHQWSLDPNAVSFVPAQPVAGLQRVWMEKSCFCMPTLNNSSQTLMGSLRIESTTSGRVAGRVSLQAEGVIAPTTSIQETADVAVAFDVLPGVLRH